MRIIILKFKGLGYLYRGYGCFLVKKELMDFEPLAAISLALLAFYLDHIILDHIISIYSIILYCVVTLVALEAAGRD